MMIYIRDAYCQTTSHTAQHFLRFFKNFDHFNTDGYKSFFFKGFKGFKGFKEFLVSSRSQF